MNCAKGWEYRTENVDNDSKRQSPVPNTRRGRVSRLQSSSQDTKPADDKIVLIRQVDGAEFKVGDAIEVAPRDKKAGLSLEFCIIKQIQWGTSEFILVHVIWLLRPFEVTGLFEGLAEENEVFLTPYFNELKYVEFIRHINILSEDQFEDIVIDDSNSSNTFLLRRMTDDYGKFSKKFDYLELHELLMTNQDEFTDKVIKMPLPVTMGKDDALAKISRAARLQRRRGVANSKTDTKLSKTVNDVTSKAQKNSNNETDTSEQRKNTIEKEDTSGTSENSSNEIEVTQEIRVTPQYLRNSKPKPGTFVDEDEESNDSKFQSDYVADDNDLEVESEEDEDVDDELENIKLSDVELSDAGLSDDEFSDEEFGKKRKKKKQSPRKDKTPSPKRKSIKAKAKAKAKAKTNIKDNGLEEVYSAVTPTKKIKFTRLDRSSLPVFLSPTKNIPGGYTDPTSQAFREMKQKLHTSQKLNALPGREDEFAMIYMNLESAVNEGTGCCVYVSGVPGMGKTATIKDVVQQMTESYHAGEIKPFGYLELNGLKLLSPNVAYEILWEHISGHIVSSSHAALLLEEYFKKEQPNRKPLIVLMDELDQIATKKQNVMYNFFNWPTYNTSKLIVVAVANTMDLPERVLSNKISSRLGLRRIQFKGYTFQQLADIITHRLEMITKNNRRKVRISPDAIGFASRKVASVSGDARRALTICRRAVEIAEKQYFDDHKNRKGKINYNEDGDEAEEAYEVLISHISMAINETVNSPLAQFISTLPFASKLVLTSILRVSRRTGFAENKLGDIISEMKNSLVMSTDSKEKKTGQLDMIDILYTDKILHDNGAGNSTSNLRIHFFKQIVTSLVEAGVIVSQTSAGDRSKLIQLNVSEEEIISVLKKDNQIAGFV